MDTPLTELQQFLGAYFNQDWMDEHASADEVIDSFLIDSSTNTIVTVRQEIVELLQSHTNESALLEDIFHKQHCYYYYPNRWSSGFAWLNHILSIFDKHLLTQEKPT